MTGRAKKLRQKPPEAKALIGKTPPAPALPAVLACLAAEHRHMTALTGLLEVRAARKQKLTQSDYFLMRDVVAYLHDYPDQVHHPTEDMLFERLARLRPDLRDEVKALQSQHRELAEQSDSLLAQLEQAADGVSLRSEKALRASIRDFVSSQNSHMQRESRQLFPAALADLRPADWQVIARRVSLHEDPLFGPQVQPRHRTLFEYLLDAEREFGSSMLRGSMALHERLLAAVPAADPGSLGPVRAPGSGMKPRLVFFDLDGTVLDGYSVLFFLARRQLSLAPGATERLRQVTAVVRHIAGQSNFEAALSELALGLRGVSDTEMWQLAEDVFARDLASRIYPEARELIRQHQQQGDRVAILSSATQYQVGPIARELGVEHVLCTQLAVASDKLTGMLRGPACYGGQKLQVAREFAKKHRQKLADSVFYSDGYEDLPLLKAVREPQATNPDTRLARVAQEHGWPIWRFTPRGLPGWKEVLATGFVYGSLLPSFVLAAPLGLAANAGSNGAAAARGPRRAISNIGFNLWGKLGTAVAGLELDVTAEQHLWSQRPAVFVFNHQSAVDALIIARLLKKDFTGLAKQEMKSNPLLGPVLSFADVVFIDRKNRGDAGIQAAIDTLRSGISIVVAPEGRRSDGRRLGAFKKGAFQIAMQARVPVIPIVIENASDALPRSAWFIRPARIRISVLKPISTKGWRASILDKQVAACRRAFLQVLEQPEKDST